MYQFSWVLFHPGCILHALLILLFTIFAPIQRYSHHCVLVSSLDSVLTFVSVRTTLPNARMSTSVDFNETAIHECFLLVTIRHCLLTNCLFVLIGVLQWEKFRLTIDIASTHSRSVRVRSSSRNDAPPTSYHHNATFWKPFVTTTKSSSLKPIKIWDQL